MMPPVLEHQTSTDTSLIRIRRGRRSTLWTLDPAAVAIVDALVQHPSPLEIEIGCGKGWFAIARAEQAPQIQVLGIDRADRYLRRGRKRIRHRRLGNVTLIKAEIRLILARCIPAGRVSAFHIYFPDPWPKRRHRDRRLVTPGFLAHLHESLRSGGVVEVATDVAAYAEEAARAATTSAVTWQEIRRSVNHRLFAGNATSGYEDKCLAAGRPVYYLELQK